MEIEIETGTLILTAMVVLAAVYIIYFIIAMIIRYKVINKPSGVYREDIETIDIYHKDRNLLMQIINMPNVNLLGFFKLDSLTKKVIFYNFIPYANKKDKPKFQVIIPRGKNTYMTFESSIERDSHEKIIYLKIPMQDVKDMINDEDISLKDIFEDISYSGEEILKIINSEMYNPENFVLFNNNTGEVSYYK